MYYVGTTLERKIREFGLSVVVNALRNMRDTGCWDTIVIELDDENKIGTLRVVLYSILMREGVKEFVKVRQRVRAVAIEPKKKLSKVGITPSVEATEADAPLIGDEGLIDIVKGGNDESKGG